MSARRAVDGTRGNWYNAPEMKIHTTDIGGTLAEALSIYLSTIRLKWPVFLALSAAIGILTALFGTLAALAGESLMAIQKMLGNANSVLSLTIGLAMTSMAMLCARRLYDGRSDASRLSAKDVASAWFRGFLTMIVYYFALVGIAIVAVLAAIIPVVAMKSPLAELGGAAFTLVACLVCCATASAILFCAWLAVRWTFAVPMSLAEPVAWISAMHASSQFAKGRVLRCAAFIVAAVLVSCGISLPACALVSLGFALPAPHGAGIAAVAAHFFGCAFANAWGTAAGIFPPVALMLFWRRTVEPRETELRRGRLCVCALLALGMLSVFLLGRYVATQTKMMLEERHEQKHRRAAEIARGYSRAPVDMACGNWYNALKNETEGYAENMNICGITAAAALVGSAMMTAPCHADAAKYKVENGDLVIESPFDLEIGSPEYAKALGSSVRTSSYANYDPETKKTTTNYYHSGSARLSEPYFGCSHFSLSFKGENKLLDSCHLACPEWSSASTDEMTYAECREMVKKIAADIEKRLSTTIGCITDRTEREAKERVRDMVEENKRKNKKIYGFRLSFVHFSGTKEGKYGPVEYGVSGEISDKGKYSVSVSFHKPWEPPAFSMSRHKIPVYTNEMHSAEVGKIVPTDEQKAAHQEAKKLRETVNRLFCIDLDTPSKTNELSSSVWKPGAKVEDVIADVAKHEWTPMPEPFEGMTERKLNQTFNLLSMPFSVFTLRRPYEGDASEEELKAQAKRFLDRLEKEYGEKIPKSDTEEGNRNISKMFGSGVPTFGDTRTMLGLDKVQCFLGKVGDLSVEVSYAEPRYAKKDGKFEIVRKAAVVVCIVQSPIISLGKTKK